MGRYDYEDEMRRADEHEKELQRRMSMDDGVHSKTVSGFAPRANNYMGSTPNNMYVNQNYAPNGYQQYPNGFNAAPAGMPRYMQTGRQYRRVYGAAADPVKSKRALNALAAIFLILAIVLFAIMGFVVYAMQRSYERCTATTQATVVENVRKSSSSKTYAPVFEYKGNDTVYRQQSSLYEKPARYKVGEVVELHYNPFDPEEYYVDKNFWIVILVMGTVGGSFALVGIICLAAKSKVNKRQQNMMQ